MKCCFNKVWIQQLVICEKLYMTHAQVQMCSSFSQSSSRTVSVYKKLYFSSWKSLTTHSIKVTKGK